MANFSDSGFYQFPVMQDDAQHKSLWDALDTLAQRHAGFGVIEQRPDRSQGLFRVEFESDIAHGCVQSDHCRTVHEKSGNHIGFCFGHLPRRV